MKIINCCIFFWYSVLYAIRGFKTFNPYIHFPLFVITSNEQRSIMIIFYLRRVEWTGVTQFNYFDDFISLRLLFYQFSLFLSHFLMAMAHFFCLYLTFLHLVNYFQPWPTAQTIHNLVLFSAIFPLITFKRTVKIEFLHLNCIKSDQIYRRDVFEKKNMMNVEPSIFVHKSCFFYFLHQLFQFCAEWSTM